MGGIDPDRVLQVIEWLEADYQRQGHLSLDDVLRVVERAKLTPLEALEVQDGVAPLLGEEDIAPAIPDDRGAEEEARVAVRSLLSPDEEVTLKRRVSAGDRARALLNEGQDDSSGALHRQVQEGRLALERYVGANQGLVGTIAARYARLSGLSRADLHQEGNLGLLRAIERFDPDRGFRFSTYAVHWIRQSITRALADRGRLIRIPVHANELVFKIRRAGRKLTWELGRKPTVEEIAAQVGIDVATATALLDISRSPVSLDSSRDEEGEGLVAAIPSAIPSPERLLVSRDSRELVHRTVNDLPVRERDIMTKRFGLDGQEPRTLEQIGEVYGVTRERIRQIESKVLKRLAKKDVLRQLDSTPPPDRRSPEEDEEEDE